MVSPLPSALSRDAVHGVRALNMVIPLTIITAIGVYYFFKSINNNILKRISIVTITGFFIISMAIYLDAYFVHLPMRDSQHFLYGYKQIVEKTRSIANSYNQIVVQQSFDQPYIFFLFYDKVDPSSYQNQVKFVEGESGDVGHVSAFGNIVFRDIDWPKDKDKLGMLMIAHEDKYPLYEIYDNPDYKVESVNYLDNKPAFLLVESTK